SKAFIKSCFKQYSMQEFKEKREERGVFFRDKYSLGCLLGVLFALLGLSLGEWRFLSFNLFLDSPPFVSVNAQIAWALPGFLIFMVGETCFFLLQIILAEKKRLVDLWKVYIVKTTFFLAACVSLVQRSNGYTAFSSILMNYSFYLDNKYTGMTQSIVLTSIVISLCLVLTADFLLRVRLAEKPGEKFYRVVGSVTLIFGLTSIFLVFFRVPSYSFNFLPGIGYIYTQQVLLSTVDSFELIGIYLSVLGCIVICFQKIPPLIKRYQLIGGSILIMLAFPLAFIPVQIWIERNIFYSSLLAPLELDILHGIFPLNFNLFTSISLILFTTGVCLYVLKSKIKTLTLVALLIYIYEYPGLHGAIFSYYNIPVLTPTVPLPMHFGLAVAATILSTPLVVQKDWNIKGYIRKIFKPSPRNTIKLLVIFAILIPIIILNTGSRVNSTPLTQFLLASQSLSLEERIDPYLLNLSITGTENIPVILRFEKPISQDDINKLNSTSYSFFTFGKHNGDYAIYSVKSYYAIYGNISAENSSDLREKLVRLVNDFQLCYILFDRNPSTPPDIDAHYATYYFVGADIIRQAFNISGKDTTLVVVDSGINDYAEELREKKNGRVIYQVNFLTGQEGDPRIVGELTPESPLKHGTLVATDVAGVKGIAPDANIIDIKIKTGSGESFYMTCVYMAEALDWCIRNRDRFNISVVALALGSRYQVYGFLTDAVDRAFLNGIVVIVAAGGYLDVTKNHIGGLLTPGISDWGITVAATISLQDESWSPISPLGPSPHWWLPKPELTCPGIFTSSSVPIVAGIALLLIQKYAEMGLPPLFCAVVIRWALIAGAQEHDLGIPGWDIQYGFGRADALTSFLYMTSHVRI
ncbi:MAG: S8 family serine peptidase, partial [Candidatus Jordarchaeaceae archaeon]